MRYQLKKTEPIGIGWPVVALMLIGTENNDTQGICGSID